MRLPGGSTNRVAFAVDVSTRAGSRPHMNFCGNRNPSQKRLTRQIPEVPIWPKKRKNRIEVALYGPWGKTRQPTMPIAVDDIVQEGIDAAKAGAGIVHFLTHNAETGIQKDGWQIYARIIEGIRAEVDVITYPTVPLAGSTLAGDAETAEARYRRYSSRILFRAYAGCDRGLYCWGRPLHLFGRQRLPLECGFPR
jgi:hypothetical protein